MSAVGEAHAGACPAHLLHRDAMLKIAETRAAPLLLDGDAVQAERAHGHPKAARKGVGAVDFIGARGDLGGREAAHGVAQHFRLLPQAEIESPVSVPHHGSSLAGQPCPAA